ncbi:PQQ-binding-like beta-propeller repeat protein [Nocardia colli]|uniref:PQQ-binding-like beta-propeller repeat protein n=1 Tax=Nocardia colli TaxID=2545717 RepID=A0A5N0EJV4_9NOCA|nr:PQQ-binding-like beta-propeller repeat protein [Nocardia colli]KAA8888315.1 PQQ-binding-like beta-propeller repeat protein [Nocardia colli]
MLAPERRTRADVISAAAIAVLVVIAAVVVWVRGDANGTESVTASSPVPTPVAADQLPTTLRELWHAPDTASSRALTSAGVAVTGDDGTVTGHDPRTGQDLWHYRRDMPLCGIEGQFSTVVAVYRDERGCSQATLLAGENGARRTARSSYMDPSVRLSVDGTYVLAQGPKRLEMWRSDLVRTIEYGFVDAPVNVKTQPRKGCTLLSSGSSPSRLGVLERCPEDAADRLTMLNPAPKDNTVPEEFGSHVLTGAGSDSPDARVLAVSDNRIVLYLPGAPATAGVEAAAPRLAVFDATGNPIVVHQLSAPLSDKTTTTRIGSAYLVFTGNSVIALNGSTFDPIWTAAGALGSPGMMAGRLLMPTAGAIAALDPTTGAEVGRIPVERPGYTGAPISLAVLGTIVLERRGTELYALG